MVRLEAVVAEAEREQIRWSAEGGVGAASVGGGNEHAAFVRRVFQDLFEFPRLDQRNVGGNHERAGDAALLTNPRGHLDGAGFAGILDVWNDFEFIAAGGLGSVRIPGDPGPTGPA